MSANLIIFEGQYMADQMRNIDKAKNLTEEAIEILKKASQHRNWQCNERAEIDNSLNTISNRLNRLDMGIIRTGNALGRGFVSVTELEKRSENQANTLSSNLQNNYGVNASNRNTNNNSLLPVTIIPAIIVGKITVAALIQWFRELMERIRQFWENFKNRNNQPNSNNNVTPTPAPKPDNSPTPAPAPKTEPTTDTVPQSNETTQQTIWNFFKDKIGNEYGVAALMGNLQAESGLNANNLQNSYESSLGMNDNSYTQAVDSGSYNNFVNDSAGYGIAQWTYYSRKQALLDFAREKGTSVGDLQTQMEFLWKELSERYTGVLNALKNASSIREASDVVLKEFERPANQSESVCAYRAGQGENFYNEMHTV
ncbi:MAG: hypothetical protein IJT21_07235 [Synergistaceae bacterium]|nr:hypothetical protein [Synergistaceae bacterium]